MSRPQDGLLEAVEAVGAAEAALEQAKERVKDEARRFIEQVGEQGVAALYWSEVVNTKVIADAVGVSIHEVRKIAGRATAGPCDSCGKPFIVTSRAALAGYRNGDRSCSECKSNTDEQRRARWDEETRRRQQRARELRTMPYRDYLKSPEWKERRTMALKRAKFRCQACNTGGMLNVHHRTYQRRGEELASDLTVLCRACHETFHETRRLA